MLRMPKPSRSRTCVKSLVARLMISPVGILRKNDGPSLCKRSSSTARSSYSTLRPPVNIVTRESTRAMAAATLTPSIHSAAAIPSFERPASTASIAAFTKRSRFAIMSCCAAMSSAPPT